MHYRPRHRLLLKRGLHGIRVVPRAPLLDRGCMASSIALAAVSSGAPSAATIISRSPFYRDTAVSNAAVHTVAATEMSNHANPPGASGWSAASPFSTALPSGSSDKEGLAPPRDGTPSARCVHATECTRLPALSSKGTPSSSNDCLWTWNGRQILGIRLLTDDMVRENPGCSGGRKEPKDRIRNVVPAASQQQPQHRHYIRTGAMILAAGWRSRKGHQGGRAPREDNTRLPQKASTA